MLSLASIEDEEETDREAEEKQSDKQRPVRCLLVPLKENVVAAVISMYSLFAVELRAPFAVAGGFLMWLRGSGGVD